MSTEYSSWVDEAACATHPLRKHHAWDYDKTKYRAEAAKVCSTCPVARECLQYAKDNPDTEGMFAGQMFKIRARRSINESESNEVSELHD